MYFGFKKSGSKKCLFCVVICISLVIIVFHMNSFEHFAGTNFCGSNIEYVVQQQTFRNQVEFDFQKAFLKTGQFLNVKISDFEDERWFQVSDHIFIYSAFADTCPSATKELSPYCVKFVGAVLSNSTDHDQSTSPIKCAFKYESHHIVKNGFAIIKKVPETHEKMYSSALLFCSLFKKEIGWPSHVSLFEQTPEDIVWLPLNVLSRNIGISPSNISVAVCVRPLYGSVSIVAFSEFLSFYSVMGVDHFIFYEFQVIGPLKIFLKLLNYANISSEILPWSMPLGENIHEYGQLIFNQDCIARTRFVFSHVIIVDLDEFIVPRKHANLKDLLENVDGKYKNAGSYVIRMALFCEEYQVKNNQYPPFHIFNSNRRQQSIWKPWFRSKYIARPDKVQMVGVHYVWFHEFNMKEVTLSDSIVLLHHYRPCCGMRQTWFLHLLSFSVLDDKVVEDNNLLKVKYAIVNNSVIKFLLSPSEYLLPS